MLPKFSPAFFESKYNGGIPDDWSWTDLSKISTPKQWATISQSEMTKFGYPVYGANGKIGYYHTHNHVNPVIAISCRGACGDVHLTEPKSYVTGNAMCLDGITNDIDQRFLYCALIYRTVEDTISGSAQPQITRENLKGVHFPSPPLAEQKKIAAILTSVDDVIETTKKQIDKLQDLKKATMNELLTKGIGHTDFKDSELGRIPKSWEVKMLDDVTIRGSGHTPDKKIPNYWNGGIKWVSLADSSNLDNRLIVSTDKEISAEGIKNSSAVLHPDGTVILSRDAGIGKSAVLMGEMAVSQHFMAWRCGDKMEKWFLYYLLQSLKPLFDMVAIGSTIKTIGLGFFKKMQIVYPPIDEQREITSIMLTIEDHIDEMKRKLTQTQSLKKSLMQDLLTGKVRVKVD